MPTTIRQNPATTTLDDSVARNWVFPPQTGHAGQVIMTDGSVISWADAVGGGGAITKLACNGYTGGGPTKLDGIASAGFTAGDWVAFNHTTDGFRVFQFTVAATAETEPTFIQCDDATGSKGWALIN